LEINSVLEVKCFQLKLKHSTMKTHGRRGKAPHILTLGLDGGEWSTSCHFTPKESDQYPCDRG